MCQFTEKDGIDIHLPLVNYELRTIDIAPGFPSAAADRKLLWASSLSRMTAAESQLIHRGADLNSDRRCIVLRNYGGLTTDRCDDYHEYVCEYSCQKAVTNSKSR